LTTIVFVSAAQLLTLTLHPVGIFACSGFSPDWTIEGVLIPATVVIVAFVPSVYLLPIILIKLIFFFKFKIM